MFYASCQCADLHRKTHICHRDYDKTMTARKHQKPATLRWSGGHFYTSLTYFWPREIHPAPLLSLPSMVSSTIVYTPWSAITPKMPSSPHPGVLRMFNASSSTLQNASKHFLCWVNWVIADAVFFVARWVFLDASEIKVERYSIREGIAARTPTVNFFTLMLTIPTVCNADHYRTPPIYFL